MKKQKKNQRVIYYENELEDDFAGTSIKEQKVIDENYAYIHRNVLWRFFSFLLYRLVAMPAVSIYCWLKFGTKIKNRKILKPYKRKGYFMYANHTLMAGDAFHPNMVNAFKRTYILVNPDAVSIKGVKTLVEMLGGMPVPTTLSGSRHFNKALRTRVVEEGQVVMVYPEAHVWPYCTKIRSFKSNSFRYPVEFKVPTFCYTTVFKKRKLFKKPKVEIFIDGPFFAPEELPVKEKEQWLRDAVYETMVERSSLSDCVYIDYQKKSDK